MDFKSKKEFSTVGDLMNILKEYPTDTQKEYNALYNQYTKQVASKRFSIA